MVRREETRLQRLQRASLGGGGSIVCSGNWLEEGVGVGKGMFQNVKPGGERK